MCVVAQDIHDPTLYLLMGICLLHIPAEHSDTPLATAIFMTFVAYQVAQTLGNNKVQSHDHGILNHIHHEAKIGENRAHKTKSYVPLLRHLRYISPTCHTHHSCPRWPKQQEPTTGYTNLYDNRYHLIMALVLLHSRPAGRDCSPRKVH